MMRSSSLEYFLESPFLWFDQTANALVVKDLEKAEKLLKEAPAKKDALEQINTAYQSMYAATQALLHSINYKSTHFRCIVTILEDHFIRQGLFNQIQLDHLLRGQKMEGTAQENFEAAEAYIAAVKKAVGKSS
jgi:hypothetical protein